MKDNKKNEQVEETKSTVTYGKYLYDGWLRIKELFVDGKRYEELENYSAVSGIVVNQQNKVLLVRQFRPCINSYSWEIPAGCLDVEGEFQITALIRELQEEADIDPSEIVSIKKVYEYYTMLGCSSAKSYIYHVNINTQSINKKILNDDVEEIKWVSIYELANMVTNGEIMDNKTQRASEYLVKEYQ